MLAYGYQWDSEATRPEELRETTLTCTRGELDQLIAMLTAFRDGAREGDHMHFRDWSGGWDKGQSDVILVLSEKQQTKRS